MKNNRRLSFILIAFLLFSCFVIQAPAQGQEYHPVRKVDLGASSLTLEVGEKYTFSVTFEPENPPVTQLIWFNTDNTVAAVNQLTNTVTALTPGTARIMAESFDKETWAVCEITVSGNQKKDLSGMVEGKSLITLSATDRAKIKASQINRYLDLMDISVFNKETLQQLQDRSMRVMAEVRPGTEEAESSRALALGMTRAYPMKHLHMVSLHGSLARILEFVKDNEDLIRIFKGRDHYFFNPLPETGASPLQAKTDQGMNTTKLQGKVEELTSVSKIHNKGYTGKGVTIAVIDTGLNPEHEQFSGRVIREHCYSYSYQCKPIPGCEPCDREDAECNIYECFDCENFISSCEGGSVENAGQSDSALSHPVKDWSDFNHGSHVTGIAAGKNGIAQGANIVAVQVLSELFDPAAITEDNPDGYYVTMLDHDLFSAYNWLLDIQDELKAEGKPIAVLNLSLGGGEHSDYCDANPDYANQFSIMQKLYAAGIIPVAAAGNERYDDGVNYPACFSNVIAVGALTNRDDPYIANYSNHAQIIDILAPGDELWSA